MKDYESEFDGCPKCGGNDGYTNVGRSHWCCCQEHKTKWCIGANLFDSWREETEEEQRAAYNKIGLGVFEEVEPLQMRDFDLKPIAGDRNSYRTHDDWFAAVLAKQEDLERLWKERAAEEERAVRNSISRDDADELPF
jgi:hypothetical protein